MTAHFASNPNVNLAYVAWNYSEGHAPNSEPERRVLIQEFHEWLAEYTRQQREEAWEEAIDFFEDAFYGEATSANEHNPYRKVTP